VAHASWRTQPLPKEFPFTSTNRSHSFTLTEDQLGSPKTLQPMMAAQRFYVPRLRANERRTASRSKGAEESFCGGFYAADAPSTIETITLMRRHMMPQIGAASNYFSSIYVPDAGRAVAAALDIPAGIYNVVDDAPLPFAEYLQTLARAIGVGKPLRLPATLGKWMFGDVWKFFSRSQRISNARLKEVSNWRPNVKSVAEGWPRVAADMNLPDRNKHLASQVQA
jgi:hypothetical protein